MPVLVKWEDYVSSTHVEMRDAVTSCTWLALWRFAPAPPLLSCRLELISDVLASIPVTRGTHSWHPSFPRYATKLLQLIPAFPMLKEFASSREWMIPRLVCFSISVIDFIEEFTTSWNTDLNVCRSSLNRYSIVRISLAVHICLTDTFSPFPENYLNF